MLQILNKSSLDLDNNLLGFSDSSIYVHPIEKQTLTALFIFLEIPFEKCGNWFSVPEVVVRFHAICDLNSSLAQESFEDLWEVIGKDPEKIAALEASHKLGGYQAFSMLVVEYLGKTT